MPGPPPKPAISRTRQPRGSALRMVQPLEDGRRTVPKPPKGLSKPLGHAWEVFWASPLAAHTTEADLMALLRLFRLYQQRENYDRIGSEEPLVPGSTKQMTLNPLLRELDSLDTKILALEDRFGLSPRARLQLQVTVGDGAAPGARRARESVQQDHVRHTNLLIVPPPRRRARPARRRPIRACALRRTAS